MKALDTKAHPEVWFFVSEIEGERASSFRQERWCRLFLEAGSKVRIFNQRGAFTFGETLCETIDQFDEFRRNARATARPTASVREGAIVRWLRRLKHLLLVDLYYPNVFALVSRGSTLLGSGHDPIVLFSSSPPFSMAIAGARLKRRHPGRITFVVDMRDAWALHLSLGGVPAIKRAIERRTLRTADHVTTVSHGLAREFEEAYGIVVHPLYNVATHYFDVMPAGEPIQWQSFSKDLRRSSMKFVYTGSTPEGFYALSQIISAVRLFRDRSPTLAEQVQLVFVGACEEVAREMRRQGPTGDSIVFISHLPHHISQQIQQAADALIFLAYDGAGNKGVVSTKLFEYFGLAKPVLPLTVHPDSDVHRLLDTYCGSSLNLITSEQVADALQTAARDGVTFLPRVTDRSKLRGLLDEYRMFVSSIA